MFVAAKSSELILDFCFSGYHATSQCYTYTVEDNMWRTAGSMNYPRTRFGYDAHPDWGFVAATGEG